jgi:hypothetical protein
MKRKLLKLIILCLFLGLNAGFIPATAGAQDEANQKPQLLIKIRNIDQFLNDIEKLISSVQGSNAVPPQIAMIRGMLQGTDWIDPQRSIVAGIVLKEPKPKLAILIPFRKANPSFQAMISAVAGENYYLGTVPPEPGFTASPAMKEALIKASASPTPGSIVIEATMSALLDQIEPQMLAAMKKIEASPEIQKAQPGITPQESMEAVSAFLKILRQAEIVRYGLDIAGDKFTLLFDVETLPNTPLSGLLSDPGGDSRLMSYPIDMPIQFRSRPHNMAGMLNLLGTSLGSIYRRMGVDFDKMGDIIKQFSGEAAGGLKISSDGLSVEIMYILQPGVDGEAFISNTYMPWIENYSKQVSNLASQKTGKPAQQLYERTADSTVAGVKVRGIKANFNAIIPTQMPQTGIFSKAFEMRMAAVGDMMFLASSDTQLEALIKGSRNLKKSPAQGPMIQADLDIGALVKIVQSFLPSTGNSVTLPDNWGNLTMSAEMSKGKLATRTSFNIDVLHKIAAAIQDSAKKRAAAPKKIQP